MGMDTYKEIEEADGTVKLEKCDDYSGFTDKWQLKDKIDDILISTVFLSLDHSFGYMNKPVVYETMVFGGKLDGEQERYHTRAEAIIGHQKMIERVKNEQ